MNTYVRQRKKDNIQSKKDSYGWGEVYHNNTCILKNPDVLWFNGVDEEMMVEYTPELDYNTYYTPNGKEGSYILCGGTRYSFDTFAV